MNQYLWESPSKGLGSPVLDLRYASSGMTKEKKKVY